MIENILTIYQKEYRQLKRDKLSLAAIIFVPTMMLLLYGYALNFDVKHVKLGVLDESNTKQSRELTEKFFSTQYFDFAGVVPKESAINKFIQDGKGAAVLVIPRNYAKKILLGKSENVQVILDGSNSNTATIVIGYVDGILQNYSSALTAKYVSQKGLPISIGAIDFRPRVYYNPGLKSMIYLVPGLVAFILMILTTIVPTISIVREKERGTIEHIMLAPVNSFEVIIGKALLYFILSLGATAMVLVTSVVLFDVPVRGNILLLAFTIILFLIAGLGIGILISTLASTQQQGYLFASTLSNLPNMILSGFIYPISSMPIWMQGITYFFPGRFFIAALRGILLKGAGFTDIYDQILPVLFFAIAIPALASWRLSKKGI